MQKFEASVTLPCSMKEVFEFLIQPPNIKLISPSSMGLYFVTAPERLSLGAKMHFKVQAYGVVREAVHEVTDFTPSTRFIEQQVSGPMKHWVHEHVFEETAGGVVVVDRIHFEPPSGVAGLLINKNRILDNLEEGFDYRHGRLEELLSR